jgi:hypothetical protein
MGGQANQRLRKRGVEEGASGGGHIGKGQHGEGWHGNEWHDDGEEQHGKTMTSRGRMVRQRHGKTAARQRTARQRAAQRQQGAARRDNNGKEQHNGWWHDEGWCNDSEGRQVETMTARGSTAGGMRRRVVSTRGGMVMTVAQKAARGGGLR